jgi:hypothetical protein
MKTEKKEVLYNGIVLPKQWPPIYDRNPHEPMPVPYLDNPPDVIPVDVGRQLFVDDFLVETTTLSRTFYEAEYHSANPVLKPEKPWEINGDSNSAAPFSGGVWYDPQLKLFKMWYAVSTNGAISYAFAYATSKDGIHWEKPALDVQNLSPDLKGTNIVLNGFWNDSSSFWVDYDDEDPKKSYKYFATERYDNVWYLVYRTSPDGIHWSSGIVKQPIVGDRTTVFYNPFRRVWVVSERIDWGMEEGYSLSRARAYTEDPSPDAAIAKVEQKVNWCAGEYLDPRNPVAEYKQIPPELYNLDVMAYESLMVGQFSIWTGPENQVAREKGLHKRCDILLGFSRDGFHWDRTTRKRFIAATWDDNTWNFANIQSVTGSPIVVGDKLYFYVSGRANDPTGHQGNITTGLAVLRRDGFASMDAGATQGMLTTRPITFNGKYLFVNADCKSGELRAEILNQNNEVIGPYSKDNCVPFKGNSTMASVKWNGAEHLSSVQGQPVKIRFYLTNGSLFSFWVSADTSGASQGFVGGRPGIELM